MPTSTSFNKSLRSCLSVGFIAIFLTISNNAQAQTPAPPARTYHVDESGNETRVVKERWAEDEDGERHGKYIRYDDNGKVRENATYVHGAKTGPAYIISDISSRVRYDRNKFVGNYTDGNRTGLWKIYKRSDNSLEAKRWYNENSIITNEIKFENGKIVSCEASIAYQPYRKDGADKIYFTETEYASGRFEKGIPVGTWMNAGLDSNGSKIEYKKGYALLFDAGKPQEMTMAEAKRTNEMAEKEAARLKELGDRPASSSVPSN